jgi:hypothetical protein
VEAAAQDAVMAAQEMLEELSRVGRANVADFVRAFLGPVTQWKRSTS